VCQLRKKEVFERAKKKEKLKLNPTSVDWDRILTLFPALHRACVLCSPQRATGEEPGAMSLRGNVAQLEAALQEAVQ
jgi:hypothetical protein